MRRRLSRLGGLLLLALTATALRAQELPVTLLADRVTYDPREETLIAEGQVEIHYQGTLLQARRITYDDRSGTITAEGPVRLTTPDGVVLLADLTQLTPDLREGLIEGARLLVDERLQIAAVEARRSEGRFITFHKVIGSSCQVCAARPTPSWAVRAENVVYDQREKQFHFQNAWFDVFGVPVAYFPYFRVPDPSLGRADGFLAPQFITSELWGYGIKIPYYKTLGDHADITLTPVLTTGGAALLEAEYRQNFANGQIRLEGAISIDDAGLGEGSGRGRGFILGNGRFDIGRGYRADFQVERATDNDFLQQFDYSDADRLTSRLEISRFRAREFFNAQLTGYQSLRDDEDQATIPFVLPQAEYRNTWTNLPIPGRVRVEGDLLNLRRRQGLDVIRAGGGIDWEASRTLPSGIQLSALAGAQFDYYDTTNNPSEPDGRHFRLSPTVGAEIRWPFSRRNGGAIHVIEPIAQVFYTNEPDNPGIPNEDSLLPELDETNLFRPNRFPGRDVQEDGLRANIGFNYTYFDPDGWNAGITVGQVFRTEASAEFNTVAGLTDTQSDLVLAGSVETGWGYVLGRALLDQHFEFRRQDLEFSLGSDRFDLKGAYVFLPADDSNPIIGAVPERNEVSVKAAYRISDNWQIGGDYRYDLVAEDPIEAGGLVSYRNECIKLDLSVSQRFTSSDNVEEDLNFGLVVSFAGLGGDSAETWPSDRCKSGWRG